MLQMLCNNTKLWTSRASCIGNCKCNTQWWRLDSNKESPSEKHMLWKMWQTNFQGNARISNSNYMLLILVPSVGLESLLKKLS